MTMTPASLDSFVTVRRRLFAEASFPSAVLFHFKVKLKKTSITFMQVATKIVYNV